MLSEQLLDRLSATWRAHGVPIEDALAPGRAVESFTSDDGRLHVDLPAELRMWWAWHDGGIEGRRPVSSWMMGPVLIPMSSTKSREWWQTMMREATAAAAEAPEGSPLADLEYWWRETWVPLFNPGAGYLAADCELGPARGTPIRRIEWGVDDGPPAPAVDSLGQMVEWWIEMIELGIWTWDKDRSSWRKAPWDPEVERRYNGLS